MNRLVRAKQSVHLVSSFNESTKPAAAALHRYHSYSTKPTRSVEKVQNLAKSVTKKSSRASPTFDQKIRQQEKALVWPKPREIPFQERVANSVNFIGYVDIPVRFETCSDGKHFATTVISVENGNDRNTMSIPVVFEGNLAHSVACHVKENDCVYVSGLLNIDTSEFVQIGNFGKFHVVAENLNFVEGYEKKYPDNKRAIPIAAVDLGEVDSFDGKLEEEQRKTMKPDFRNKRNTILEPVDKKCADEKVEELQEPVKPDFHNKSKTNLEPVNKAPVVGNTDEKSEERAVSKKKYTDDISSLWMDLMTNPLQWWDYRNHKSNGLVKERFPDFKQKVTGNALWVSSAPKWALPAFEKLEFDVPDLMPKQVPRREVSGEISETWKSLLENPNKWWDNRVNKKNPKAPDFKHKVTGEGLWVHSLPVCALSKLPPVKDGQNN